MKNSRPLLLSRPAVISALVIGLVLVVGTALLSAVSTRAVEIAGARVGHARTTLLQINQLLATMIDAETGQRGYILTNLEKYLEPYNSAKARITDELGALDASLADSPEQTASLAEIKSLTTQKFAEMDRTIALRHNSVGAALNVVGTGEGLVTMDALRKKVHVLEQNELAELNMRSALAARHARESQLISLGLITLAVALGLTGARLLILRVRELEDLITVCAWTNRVKYEGKWVSFEQYLHKRFNLRFTHGISEEATRKLMLEEVELHAGSRKPVNSATPFPSPEGSATRV
ncbi:MAG TPA: CHASE3 domain-containing protein [Rariglobus sp.]|nr:CHASE3 domain-containing protein [Rariglobus sp.]